MKRKLCLVLFALLLFFAMSLPVSAKVSLNKKSVTLSVGTSVKLKVSGTNKKVKWSSSNSSVATVNSGKVVAKAPGKATIYAKVSGKTLSCKVNVKTVDLSAYYGAKFSKVKKTFPKLKKIESPSSFGGYYGYKGIKFLFDSGDRVIRVVLDEKTSGYSIYGFQPGMSFEEFSELMKSKTNIKYVSNPTYGLIYKVNDGPYFVMETGISNDGTSLYVARLDLKPDMV